MKFEDLKLDYGYPLQLQVENAAGQSERLSCRLIGCLPGRSIILSVPRRNGRLLRFRPGQKLIARMMVANGVGVFTCDVESQTGEPYPLLHVLYPDSVAFKGIRGATRVAVNLPVTVGNLSQLDEKEIAGVAADMSISGARLELEMPVGDIGDNIRMKAQVDIAGIEREMVVNGVIRSRVERSTQEYDQNLPAVYGVEFTETDEDLRLLLFAYVFSRIAHEQLP